MKLTENHKLFFVEFGEPDVGGWITISSSEPKVYVIAMDYNEAVAKALDYISNMNGIKNIIATDGSLRSKIGGPPQIKSVKILTEDLIY